MARTSSESDLGDDVVTLSYDRALRAHARYQPVERRDWQPEPAPRVDESLTPQASRAPQDVFDRDLRTASVTVRLSKSECASLHQRAAEAGLTVSAYLRSCTIEAEALRAQVKAALAELRSAGMKDKLSTPVKERRTFWARVAFGWLASFLPRRHSASRA
ncbi:MAG: plasmid mobilization protein [Terracidiphilus sp.]